MVEYVLATGVLLATVAVFAVVLLALRMHSSRVLSLVASDYP